MLKELLVLVYLMIGVVTFVKVMKGSRDKMIKRMSIGLFSIILWPIFWLIIMITNIRDNNV